MDIITSVVYSAGFALCFTVVFKAWRKRALRNGLPLPPGPKGLPLIGNVFDINSSEPWLSYEQWGKQYGKWRLTFACVSKLSALHPGDIVYSTLLGQEFIIINSAKLAHVLLDQRSAIYSDRPHMSTNKLFGMDFALALLPYGNEWKFHRKLFSIAINKQTMPQYKTRLMQKAHQLLENLLDAPKDYDRHFKTVATAIAMGVAYDYDVVPHNDPVVTKIETFVDLFLAVLTPERAALFGAFPFLAHIPSWLPGGRYKQRAAECRGLAVDVLNDPVNYVKDKMASGTARESLVNDLFEKGYGETDEDIVKAVAASVFLGGVETIDSSLLMFHLAMVLNPDVQTKAQEEIDRVVGNERLPNFDDRPALPYIEGVYLETLRWQPVAPLGVPHMTSTSDVYGGMYIPEGAMVIANIWAMSHDERYFAEPMAFKPERHLTSTGTLVEGIPFQSFGFGRRSCPGKHLAEQSLWATIVSVLATLRIAKAKNEFGEEIDVKPEFTPGVTTAPKPFICSIKARSPSAERLARETNRGEL
ncbi:cytochrome P450 [Melanogaster broomeanus]|nr:cytochrome P450 [Melanogaster broomeanus]